MAIRYWENVIDASKHQTLSVNDVKNRINNICNALYKNAHRFKHNVKSLVFKKTDIDLLNNLKSDPNIVITKPDKGKWIVILDKATFETKVDNILNDSNTFKLINGDLFNLIIKLEDKFNRILRSIKNNIGENLHKSLYASGTVMWIWDTTRNAISVSFSYFFSNNFNIFQLYFWEM